MNSLKILEFLIVLPQLVLIYRSIYFPNQLSMLLSAIAFLFVAILLWYQAFVGNKRLEKKDGNSWRGGIFLSGFLFLLFFAILFFVGGYSAFIFYVLISSLLYLFYCVLLYRIFPEAKGTRGYFKDFFGRTLKLLLISLLMVLLIGIFAFTLGMMIN